MAQSIIPRGLQNVNGIIYIGVYIPVEGKFVVARKQAVPNGFTFDYMTMTGSDMYDHVWADPSQGVYVQAIEMEANLAVLCNQLSTSNTTQPLTESQLRGSAIHVIVDNATGAAAQQHVLIDNPTTAVAITGSVTVANPTANPETGLAKEATLTSGAQKTQVTNFPATQAITGSVAITNLPATQPVSGTVTVANPATSVAVSNFPAPVTSVSVSNLPATQPVSIAANTPDVTDRAARLLGHVTVDNPVTAVTISNFPAAVTTVAVSNLPATQAVSGAFWQTTQPVSGTFFQATQPVSAVALPLPTGASTAALQTTGNTSLATIASNTATGPKTTGGLTSKVVVTSAASANATVVKNTAGQLYTVHASNTAASARYLNLYNLARAPLATDVPVEVYAIPAGQFIRVSYGGLGSGFATGIAFNITSTNGLLGTLTALLVPGEVVANFHFA